MDTFLGVIYIYDNSNNLLISNCNFYYSTAGLYGGIKLLVLDKFLGVIYFYSNSNSLNISDCTFSYSTTLWHGGM